MGTRRSVPGRNDGKKSDDFVTSLVTYKQCKWCGEIAAVRNCTDYSYKYKVGSVMLYFCSYGCMNRCKQAYKPKKIDGKYPMPKGTWEKPIE